MVIYSVFLLDLARGTIFPYYLAVSDSIFSQQSSPRGGFSELDSLILHYSVFLSGLARPPQFPPHVFLRDVSGKRTLWLHKQILCVLVGTKTKCASQKGQ